MTDADQYLEDRIHLAYIAMIAAETRESQRYWLAQIGELVERRSPERVREMERERGIG